MNVAELSSLVERMDPTAKPQDVARMCMFLFNSVDHPSDLKNPSILDSLYSDLKIRLEGACDQHAAMTEEVKNLAASDPTKYSPDQVWILVRAIKVQSQLLQLYTAGAAPEMV